MSVRETCVRGERGGERETCVNECERDVCAWGEEERERERRKYV